jgi:hypothetical protein
MHNSRYLILAALVCAALAVAGCTTAPAAPATPSTPAPAVSLPAIAFTPADLPTGYVLTMDRQKNVSELSELAMRLGWQAGYIVEYTDSRSPEGRQNVISQTLTTYPESSMQDVIAYISKVDHSYPDLIYTDIPLKGLGLPENSRIFVGGYNPPEVQAQVMLAVPTTANPLSSADVLTPASSREPNGQGFVEVIFSKGTTLEVIRMSGPTPNDREMIALAQKAYQKIP